MHAAAQRSGARSVRGRSVGFMRSTVSTIALAAALAVVATTSACKKKAAAPPAKGSGSAVGSGSAAGSAALPPVIAAPGVAPMGPADAIEPPSRVVLPGMTEAQAKANGAVGVDGDLKVGTNIELDIGADSHLVESLDVEYPTADWETLKKGWGAPHHEETWVGANWVATLNGCNGSAGAECGVTFVRSPAALLTK